MLGPSAVALASPLAGQCCEPQLTAAKFHAAQHTLLHVCPLLPRSEGRGSDGPSATHYCLTPLSPTCSQPCGSGSCTCRPASKPQLDSSAPLVGLPSFLEPASASTSTGLYFVSLMEDTPSLVNSAGSEVRPAVPRQLLGSH